MEQAKGENIMGIKDEVIKTIGESFNTDSGVFMDDIPEIASEIHNLYISAIDKERGEIHQIIARQYNTDSGCFMTSIKNITSKITTHLKEVINGNMDRG